MWEYSYAMQKHSNYVYTCTYVSTTYMTWAAAENTHAHTHFTEHTYTHYVAQSIFLYAIHFVSLGFRTYVRTYMHIMCAPVYTQLTYEIPPIGLVSSPALCFPCTILLIPQLEIVRSSSFCSLCKECSTYMKCMCRMSTILRTYDNTQQCMMVDWLLKV